MCSFEDTKEYPLTVPALQEQNLSVDVAVVQDPENVTREKLTHEKAIQQERMGAPERRRDAPVRVGWEQLQPANNATQLD